MDAPLIPASSPAWWQAVYRALPRSLSRQIMLLTSICLVLSLLSYGAYTASRQTHLLRTTVMNNMAALARNLATVNAQFLLVEDWVSIEAISMQTAATPGIFLVQVSNPEGKLLSEVVFEHGRSVPHFGHERLHPPRQVRPFTQSEEVNTALSLHRLASKQTMSAWHPIMAGTHVGWVRVSYRTDGLNQEVIAIWTQALLIIALAITGTLVLLKCLLGPPIRALQQATRFATGLDHALGAKLQVSGESSEIQALGEALNHVSARLFTQNSELNHQKFALDQHAIVSITDLNGLIVYANDLFCDISAYSRTELLGQNHRILNSEFHPPAFFAALWSAITRGQVWHGEIKNKNKRGQFYWVNATIVPLMGVNTFAEQYISICTDITEIKNYELSLQAAKAKAEAATVAKSQFLANMSHEIRTPMNAILGMLKLLQNTELSDQQLDYTTKTEGAAQSLLGLLNDILDFSKMEAGKMELDPQPFHFDRLMRDLSVILSVNIGAKPIEVLFDIDQSMPKVLIGDVLRLRQILINLAGNAIKFTETGEVIIQIKLLGQIEDQISLRISVKDSGIGIAAENQRHIFEGFTQAESSTTRRFGGTGLGLSISRRLVEMMGGSLMLESEAGKGSTFYFEIMLPAVNALAEEADRSSFVGGLNHLHVLVVDDNETARGLMVGMARSWGWQVDVARSGQEAITLVETCSTLAQGGYQAIFVDWHMPDMDGWETILRIRKILQATDTLVIVMVTTHGRELLAQRSSEEQAALNSFLVKPVTASMLFDAVADARAGLGNLRSRPRLPGLKPCRLVGLRLLVVEDNLMNQQVAQELLSAEGALVELAANGKAGIDAIVNASSPFDAVLMDVQMPVMDGYTATHIIRHGLGMATLPVIAMTANAMDSDREACLAAGMNDHIGKPFDLMHLIQIVQSQVRQTRHQLVLNSDITSAPDQAQFPAKDELDLTGALERLGNNTGLYGRVLQSFLSEVSEVPARLDAFLRAGKREEARRLMHTLKGLAATVGACYLAAVAQQTEDELKTAAAEHDVLCEALKDAVLSCSQLIEPLALSYTQAAPAEAVPDTSQLLADIKELHVLLKGSDLLAFDVHARLQKKYARTAAPELKALYEAMGAFDFMRGQKQCETLLEKYGELQ
ncbi:hybrid sensor histidine kinase/response regulator [Iodobacter fluviatilis]|uniref:Sensory/regulatory protein RpfC n=1 Tax=Iodobacter fluviatilis TaxID=537 RepID=A0A377Q9P7_9NEIS|nr:response regulator [Iodobacter fluviatilis]TCU82387.1 PAS domain S-box-containing protein [Iodobacter fluviatilis]STQ91612.1 Signal transduction histidine-protein kinase BarA [Iodobacter fluviatilis]